jgi:hypothetical protein
MINRQMQVMPKASHVKVEAPLLKHALSFLSVGLRGLDGNEPFCVPFEQ